MIFNKASYFLFEYEDFTSADFRGQCENGDGGVQIT